MLTPYTSRVDVEMSKGWMTEHPILAVEHIIEFVDSHKDFDIAIKTYPTEHRITLTAIHREDTAPL